MFATLKSFFVEHGYVAAFFVLVIYGFGMPIPEDLTLVAGGVIPDPGYTSSHIMLAIGISGALVDDGFIFAAGRIWGQKIPKFKPIARVMAPRRYIQVQEKSDKYGNQVLFVARFLPGLCTTVLMTADISRGASYLRFILMGDLVTLTPIPVWIYLGEYGVRNTDWLMREMHNLQFDIFIALSIGAVIVGWIWWKRRRRHTFFRGKPYKERAAKARKQTNQ